MIRFFRKYHKWIGLIFMFFLLMFAVSGVLLNHRQLISSYDLPRSVLPPQYRYANWNNASIVGTLPLSSNSILMYGRSGVWLADSLCQRINAYTDGMADGIDNKNIRAMVKTPSDDVFAVTTFQLYRLDKETNRWSNIADEIKTDDYLSDVYARGDTLFVLTRSHIYTACAPYTQFYKVELRPHAEYDGKVSLFKTLWTLHSGELFGLTGKLIVDIVGVITIILCLTGLGVTILRIPLRKRKRKGLNSLGLKKSWLFSLNWHNRLGYLFFALLLLITLTGMFLRPPLLIPIVRAKIKPIPGSKQYSHNAWNDKLRLIRYDDAPKRWILSTSEGFFTFCNLSDVPQKLTDTPPVSVMGATVFCKSENGNWIIGSFSGIYEWDIAQGKIIDLYTGKIISKNRPRGRFSFTNPVSGYSADFGQGKIVFEYGIGAKPLNTNKQFESMPIVVEKGRISLWHTSLELHVGRLYYQFLRAFTDFFVFFAGLLFLFINISGYVVYSKRYKKRKATKSIQ